MVNQLAAIHESDDGLGSQSQPPDEGASEGDWTDAHTTSDATVGIFGDGDISCPDHRASSDSLPVGTVNYQVGEGQVRVTVSLTAAQPEWTYNNIELWSAQNCTMLGAAGTTLRTDANGAGEVSFVVSGLEPGTYRVNVNVSSPGEVPGDRRYREMGSSQFVELVVG